MHRTAPLFSRQRAGHSVLAALFLLSLGALGCEPDAPDEVVPEANTPKLAEVASVDVKESEVDAEKPGAGREVQFPSKKREVKAEVAPTNAPTWMWAVNKDLEGITQREAFGILPGSEQLVRCRFTGGIRSDHVSIGCASTALQGVNHKPEDFSSMWSNRFDGQFVNEAALVIDGEHLYVVNHSMIATGATAMKFDLRSGKQLWKVDLEGVGPVGHSKYRNEVQVRIERGLGGEYLTVFGRESSGRYIERLSLKDGKQLSNHKLTSRYPEISPPVASLSSYNAKSDSHRAYGTHGGTDVSYVVAERGDRAMLTKQSTSGKDIWSTSVKGYTVDQITDIREYGDRVLLMVAGKDSVHLETHVIQGHESGAVTLTASHDFDGQGQWFWQQRGENIALYFGVPAVELESLEVGDAIPLEEKLSYDVFELDKNNRLVSHVRVTNDAEANAILHAPGARWGARFKVSRTIATPLD